MIRSNDGLDRLHLRPVQSSFFRLFGKVARNSTLGALIVFLQPPGPMTI
jgi:hypothetical protein